METYAEYLARTQKEQQNQKAAQAGIVINSVDAKPDQAAADLMLAQEYAKTTGKQQPPLPMVSEHRSVFQQEIENKRNSTILTGNPKLADWLRNPVNAAIAKDSLEELAKLEQEASKPWTLPALDSGVQRTSRDRQDVTNPGEMSFLERLGAALGPGVVLQSGVFQDRVAAAEATGRAANRGVTTMTAVPPTVSAIMNNNAANDIGKTEEQLLEEVLRQMNTDAATASPQAYNLALTTAKQRFEMAAQFTEEDRDQMLEDRDRALAEAQAIFDRVRSIPMSETASRFRDNGLAEADNSIGGFFGAVASDPSGAVAFILETAAESLPLLAGSTAATFFAGPVVGATTMGAGSFAIESTSEVNEFLREKGVDFSDPEVASSILQDPAVMREAQERGLTRGVIVGVLDAISGGVAGQTLSKSPIGNMLLQMLAQAALGAGGEALAQKANGDPLSWAEIIIEGLAELATAPIEVAGVGGQAFVDIAEKADKARAAQERLQNFVDNAIQSKVRERAPDAFRDYLTRTLDGKDAETMYVPADRFTEYFQSVGMNVEDVISQLDGVDPNQVAEAIATGGDIAIPTATFAAKIAGSQHDQFLLQNSRFNPDDMTFAEAEEWEATKATLLDEAMQQAETIRAQAEVEIAAGQQVFDTMVERLTQAGRDIRVASQEAAIWRAWYETRAARSGKSVAEIMAMAPLPEVRGQGQQARQAAPQQADATEGGLYDQTGRAAVDSEPFKQWFGNSAVVDDQGAPLVVYHGTGAEFDSFSADASRVTSGGFFFSSSPQIADEYSKFSAGYTGGKKRIVDAYLSIANPLTVNWQDLGVGENFQPEAVEQIIADAKAQGYDGVVLKGLKDGWSSSSPVADTYIAFDPTQIKSVNNRGTFDRSSPNILEQAGVPLFDTPLTIDGKVTVRSVGEAMTADHLAKHGRQFFPEDSEEDYKAVLGWAAEEVATQLQHPNSGVGWYSRDVQLSMELAARVYPTLATNPTHRDLYLVFAGLFSNGAEPEGAFMNSAEAFETFLATGEIPVNRADAARARGEEPKQTSYKDRTTGEQVTKDAGWGIRNPANEQQLAFVKYIFEREGGVDAGINWLRSKQPRTEINRAMTESGLYKQGRYTTKAEIAGEPAYGIMAFGEKLGRYTMGLHGVEIDAGDTTIDLWYSRTYRRLTGRLLETPIGAEGVVSGPTDKDRQVIFRMTGDLVKQFDLPAGDIQAVLWFWEKRLWGAQGIRTSEGTNSSGARKLLRAKGLDDGTGSDGAGDRSGGEAAGVEYGQGAFGDGSGGLPVGGLAPLDGAPRVAGASGPDPRLVEVAEKYAADNGIPLKRQAEFVEVDPERAARIADAYEAMTHAPQDPAVKEAYQNLINQTLAQYQALVDAGYQFYFFDDTNDPYGGNPWNAMRDLRANQRMAVYATEAGFGSGDTELNVDDNPMLADTGLMWGYGSPDGEKKRVLANDLFRAVHDAFGHGLEGAGFRARGEENAWQAHVRLFTGSAVAAITTETRGQNSWLNYGPHGEKNRTASVEETVFADQKTGLLPEWVWTEGRAADAQENTYGEAVENAGRGISAGAVRGDGAGQAAGVEAGAAGGPATADANADVPVTGDDLGRVDDPEFLREFLRRPGWSVLTATREPDDFINNTADEELKQIKLKNLADRNQRENDYLRSLLDQRGIPYMEVQGMYKGVDQGLSFLIIADEATALKLGKQFQQESILTRDGLVYSAPVPNTPASDRVMTGDEALAEDFYSVTPGGTAFSMDLDFSQGPGVPVIPEGYEVDPSRPQLPIRPDGMVELHHWSDKTLTTVDPQFAGTGPLSGEERRRGDKLGFFGINIRQTPRDPGTGYVKEGSLGENEHVALVPASRLYPFFEDPDGLRAEGANVSDYQDAIRAAGYLGYYVTDDGSGAAPLGNVAALFEAVPVYPAGQVPAPAGKEYGQPAVAIGYDNPGGSWLANKQKIAEEDMREASPSSYRSKGLGGATTAYTRSAVMLPLEMLAGLPGAQGEARAPGDPRYDDLLADVQKRGFQPDQDGNAVLVGVNHLGQAFLLEGNTRVAVARSVGESQIKAEVRWFNGGESAGGPLSPEAVQSAATAPTLLFQNNRGSIMFPSGGLAKGGAVVNLFRGADLSTFMHESGHFFLTALQEMAARGDTSAQQEFDTIKAWWSSNAADVAKDASRVTGVAVSADDVTRAITNGSSGDPAKDTAIDVGMQEQWARAFEAYLMEGKAPSQELRGAFERFADWLKAVYRSLTSLNVKVSPELKGVFDRMLATDQQIEAAKKKEADLGPLFKTAADMGLSDDEFEKYKALSQQAEDEATAKLRAEIMAPITRAQQQWWKDEKAKLVETLTKEKQAQPIYRAIQEMRFGQTFEGDETPGIKLNRKALEDGYGADVLARLPGAPKTGKGHRWAVYATGEGGMHPDVVAEMYGFANGRELVDALLSTPKLEDAVEAEADTLMTQRHGDILLDGKAAQAAMDAIKGDKKARLIGMELAALNAKLEADRPLRRSLLFPKVTQFREMARRTLDRMVIKDARAAQRYVAASRKASDDAYKAMAKGDIRTAAEAKRRHLLSHMMYMEARKIDAEVEKLVNRLSRLNRADSTQARGVDIDHIRAARAIAAKFGLANGDSQFDFDAWTAQLQQDDPATYAALSHAIQTYTQNAKPFKALTVGEFRAVADAVANLVSLGKTARTLEIEGQQMAKDQIIAELTDVLNQRGLKQNPALKAKLTAAQRMGKSALSMLSALRRVEAWARDMDDGEQGPFTRYLVRPVMDALGVYRDEKAKRLDQMLAILNPRRKDLLSGGSIAAPELGYTFETKAELIHAILHTGNESNKEKLLMGRGWSTGLINQKQKTTPTGKPSVDRKGQPIMDRGTVDTSKWDAFITRMVKEGKLTKEDFDMAQSIWDLMEELKRPAQTAHRKMFGFYFPEIEASPVVTPFGTYRGGYVPAIADQDASNDGQIRADQNALEMQQTSFMFPTTGSGFTKARVEQYRTPLALDLMLLPAHMDKVLRFTHLEPTIRQTAGIITARDMRDAMDTYDQSLISSMLTPWLQRTAQQAVEQRATTPAGRAFSNIARELRRRVGIHTMFMNVVNTAQQITGFSTAMVLVKPYRMSAALARYTAGGAFSMRAEAMAQSAFMRERVGNAARETQRRIQEAVVKPTVPSELRALIDKHGYVLQQVTQNIMDVIIWHAAYDQAIAKKMSEADAVFEADSVVRRTIGDFAPENLSLFETGNAFTRLFTMFYSYFNGQANLVGGEMKTAMRTMGWSGSPRMFWIYLMGIAAPAIVADLIVRGFQGDLGDEDDDGYADEIAAITLGSQARYITAMIPIGGQVTMAMMNRFNDQVYDDRLSTSPVVSTVERAAGAPASIAKAVQTGEGERRAVMDGLTLLALVTGIPMGQLAKMTGYGMDVASGEAQPQGTADVVQGIASGRDGTKP